MDSDSSLTDLSADLSSDLSSVGSMSPIPDYPSPALTQDNDSSASNNKKRSSDGEEQQPPKKRKRPGPKPRRTDTLDLTADLSDLNTTQKDSLHKLMQVLRKRKKIVVIAGAGISVSAGIPDFRSSTGLFKTLKGEHKLKASGKQLFDASVYQTDSSTSTFHDMVRQLSEQVNAAKPTAFHLMLNTLALEERLLRLYTQNVDGLDVNLPFLETHVPLNAKGPWPPTIQLHGGLGKMACSKCSSIFDFDSELFNGPDPPPCKTCLETDHVRTNEAGKRSHGVGRLRPRMALYNERTPDEDAIGAVMAADLRARPDALIVVGTSLKIPGVKRLVREMCGVIRDRRDGLTIWMNMDAPPMSKEFEDCWDLIVKGACDDTADLWNKSHEKEQSGSDTEKENKPSPAKKARTKASLPTPSVSPPGSDVENKPTVKLILSKNKIQASINADDSSKIVNKIKKTDKSKALLKQKKDKTKVKKPKSKPDGTITTNYRVTKAGISQKKSKKILTPKKQSISSPLSSPVLPSSPPPSLPRTPTKSPMKAPAFFPNLVNYTPSRLSRSFSLKGLPSKKPLGLDIRSSPPPFEPLSSPVKGASEWKSYMPSSKLSKYESQVSRVPSRPTSSSSQSGGTISPTSRPRGMEGLID